MRPLPPRSGRTGSFEAEGVDCHRCTGTVHVIVLSPGFCLLTAGRTYRVVRG